MTDSLPLIPIKSPLALTGVFLDILRQRFNPLQNLDWVWLPGDEGRHNSTIMIEAAGNTQLEDPGNRPAIFVLRQPIIFNQVAIRDTVIKDPKTDSELFYCVAQTSMNFSCESEIAGESELLADIVLSTVMMGSDEIERVFEFRKLGPFSLSTRAITRQDTEISRVDVQVGVSYDVRWASHRIAPLLKEIVVKARDSTYHTGEAYFIEIYQESLNVRPDPTKD